jgi:hypothetical protein
MTPLPSSRSGFQRNLPQRWRLWMSGYRKRWFEPVNQVIAHRAVCLPRLLTRAARRQHLSGWVIMLSPCPHRRTECPFVWDTNVLLLHRSGHL